MSHTVFTSQPSSVSNPTLGTQTQYDGLGRVTQVRENFGDNVTTTTEYLTGNKVRMTDPLGNQTITTQSGYGSSSDGNTLLIQQPEGVTTKMAYGLYGNILTAEQYHNQWGQSHHNQWGQSH